MAEQGVLEIATLGRPMQLGMLYDCRSDNLIPGLTLWDPDILQNNRHVRSQPGAQFNIMASDGIDDKTSSLNVNASLKASYLGGLIEVQGSAKFLNDTKSSQHQSRLTIHYRATTAFEQLTMKHLGRHNVQHPDVFDQGTATHVVTGVLYGAQAFFVFDRDCTSEENVKDVQGHLHGLIKKIVSAEIDGCTSIKMNDKQNVDKIQCKFHGDFILENNPTNYDEAVSVYKELPSMLGSNGENAVPMRIWLYPLNKLDQKAAKLVRQISVNLISQSQDILEGLENFQVKCNDMIRSDICTDFPQFAVKLSTLKKHLLAYKLSFQQYLAKALPTIRDGGVQEQTLADTLRNSVQSPFSMHQISDWIAGKEKEMNVVKAYMKLFDGIQVIRSPSDLDEIVLDPSIEYVICFSFPLGGREDFLEVLSQYLKSPQPHSNPPTKGWFDKKLTSKNIRSCARNFADFYQTNKKSCNTAFVVAGFRDHEHPASGPICLYEDGVLTTDDFELPGPPGKPSISRKSDSEITLTWQPPKCGGGEVNNYLVKYREGRPGSHLRFSDWVEENTSSSKTSISVTGLQPFTCYEFKVAGIFRAGTSNFSDTSESCTTLPASAPTNVRKHGGSATSLTIVWDQPAVVGDGANIGHYMVKYTQRGGSSGISLRNQEMTTTTVDSSCLYTIEDLQSDSAYSICVIAVCGEAGYGMKSDPVEFTTVSVHTPVKYAKAITQRAEVFEKGCQEKGKPTIFWVPLINDPVASGGKYHSYTFGTISRTPTSHTHKVIMVVGATGAGKSTLVNGMINYILQVDWKDDFRFKIVAEKESRSQAHSQTEVITSYTIQQNKNHSITYTLTIIDTPGFGDTRGIPRDKAIMEQIRNFFSYSGSHHVDHIDAIGFVAQASLPRLTPTQRYVFDSILSVFGKDISPNILLLVTFSDGKKPPIMDAIKEADIPCNSTMFKFNNSALFASTNIPTAGPGDEMSAMDGQGDAYNFDEMFWKMGIKSMWNFFKALDKLEPRSLTLTIEVLHERRCLEAAVEGLQQQIHVGVCKLEELRNEQQILEQHKAEIKANECFEYEVEVPKIKQIVVSDFITNCLKCKFTCHYPCAYGNDDDKKYCAAMNKAEGVCNVCPGKCVWNVHYNQKYKFEYYNETEQRTYAELKERYKNATGKKLTVEQVIKKHTDAFSKVQNIVYAFITDSHRSIKRLEEIALKPNPLSTKEYVDLLIDTEKTEAKPGWKSRLTALQEVRKKAEIMGEIKRPDYNPLAKYKPDFISTRENQIALYEATWMDWFNLLAQGLLK